MSRDHPVDSSRNDNQDHAEHQAIRMLNRARRSDTSQVMVGSPPRNLTTDTVDSIPSDRENDTRNVGGLFGAGTQTEEPASMFDPHIGVGEWIFPAQDQAQTQQPWQPSTHHLPHQQHVQQPMMRTQSNMYNNARSLPDDPTSVYARTSNSPEAQHAHTRNNNNDGYANNTMRLSMQTGATGGMPVTNGNSRAGHTARPRRRNIVHQSTRATQPSDRANGMTISREPNGTYDDDRH